MPPGTYNTSLFPHQKFTLSPLSDMNSPWAYDSTFLRYKTTRPLRLVEFSQDCLFYCDYDKFLELVAEHVDGILDHEDVFAIDLLQPATCVDASSCMELPFTTLPEDFDYETYRKVETAFIEKRCFLRLLETEGSIE